MEGQGEKVLQAAVGWLRAWGLLDERANAPGGYVVVRWPVLARVLGVSEPGEGVLLVPRQEAIHIAAVHMHRFTEAAVRPLRGLLNQVLTPNNLERVADHVAGALEFVEAVAAQRRPAKVRRQPLWRAAMECRDGLAAATLRRRYRVRVGLADVEGFKRLLRRWLSLCGTDVAKLFAQVEAYLRRTHRTEGPGLVALLKSLRQELLERSGAVHHLTASGPRPSVPSPVALCQGCGDLIALPRRRNAVPLCAVCRKARKLGWFREYYHRNPARRERIKAAVRASRERRKRLEGAP